MFAKAKAVLVTGASTGIGRRISERLAAAGYYVFATARKPADLESLGRIPNIQPVPLDVTREDQVSAAVTTVQKSRRGLFALLNNAGIVTVVTFAETTPDAFDRVMQVNVDGLVRVTRAFLPLLVAARGRITTSGSISGTLSPRDLGAYSMRKHAMEAFTDSLPDGVFFEDAQGAVQFHALAPPTLPDLEKLLRTLIPRLLRKLAAGPERPLPSDWMQLLADAHGSAPGGH